MGMELPGASRPRTPARGVRARGGMRPWGTVGAFWLIFHDFSNFEKKYFYNFLKK